MKRAVYATVNSLRIVPYSTQILSRGKIACVKDVILQAIVCVHHKALKVVSRKHHSSFRLYK